LSTLNKHLKDWSDALDVLYRLVTDKRNKLEYGRQKRLEMKEILKRGGKVQGYRADYLLSSAQEVMLWMTTIAESFNAKYPHDRFSVQDMTDVLASTIAMLKKKT